MGERRRKLTNCIAASPRGCVCGGEEGHQGDKDDPAGYHLLDDYQNSSIKKNDTFLSNQRL